MVHDSGEAEKDNTQRGRVSGEEEKRRRAHARTPQDPDDRGQPRWDGLLEKGWGDTRSAADPTAPVFGREEELRIQIEETGRFIRIGSGITHSDTPIPEPEASGGPDTKKGARAWVWPSTRSVQLRPPEIPSPSPSMANTWPPKPRAAGPWGERIPQ